MELPRAVARDLNDALLGELHEVLAVRWVDVEVAGVERAQGAVVPLVAEADLHDATEDRHALGTRVPVRRDSRAGQPPEAHGEHAGRLRVALQHGRLAPGQGRRSVCPD